MRAFLCTSYLPSLQVFGIHPIIDLRRTLYGVLCTLYTVHFTTTDERINFNISNPLYLEYSLPLSPLVSSPLSSSFNVVHTLFTTFTIWLDAIVRCPMPYVRYILVVVDSTSGDLACDLTCDFAGDSKIGCNNIVYNLLCAPSDCGHLIVFEPHSDWCATPRAFLCEMINLYRASSTGVYVQCTVQCTLYIVQCTLYIVQV